MSASLQGTLSEQDVLSQMEALNAARNNQLALSTQQATEAARTATEEYTGMLQAPPPDVAPLAALLNALQGNVSSVLSGDQRYQERAQQRTQQSRSQLIKARADNLSALRDVSLKRAEEADQAGDLEQTEKFRRKYELLSKQLEVLESNRKRTEKQESDEAEDKAKREAATLSHRRELELIGARGAQQRQAAASKVPLQLELAKKGVSALGANQHSIRRTSLANQITRTKGSQGRGAAVSNLRSFDLNTRIVNETPERFIERMRSIDNPMKPGTPLYSVAEIKAAGKRLYTEAERKVP